MTSVNASVATSRHDDRRDAENDQHDAFEQKQTPMGMDRVCDLALQVAVPGVDSSSLLTP